MSLSEREQRIISELERDFAESVPLPESAPLPGRVPSGVTPPYRGCPPAAAPARWRCGANGNLGWFAAMIIGLLAGIAILTAGLVLGVPVMMAGGAVLTQLSPAAVWLAGLLRGRPARPASGVPGSGTSPIGPR